LRPCQPAERAGVSTAHRYSGKGAGIGWGILAIWTILSAFHAVLHWYVQRVARRSAGKQDVSYQANLAGKMVSALVVAVGTLYILRIAGVDISPLLASGAIGDWPSPWRSRIPLPICLPACI